MRPTSEISHNLSQLVDKKLGDLYLVIENVNNNLAEIKHVSHYMENLYDIHTNLNSLIKLSTQDDALNFTTDNISELTTYFSNLNTLITNRTSLDDLADEIEANALLAQNYANAAEDVEVETGLYSAMHFAIKAAATKVEIETLKTNTETTLQTFLDEAEGHKNDAATSASEASTSANYASSSATAASNSENNITDFISRATDIITSVNLRPEDYYDVSHGNDWAIAINLAISAAALSTKPAEVVLSGQAIYPIETPIIYKTGVTLRGTGKQSVRIQATVAMPHMVRPADLTGNTNYYRFSMYRLWFDGNNLATNGNKIVSLRNGVFFDVYVSNTISSGWNIDGPSYYNTWYNCEHNGTGRGWLIYTQLALGPNENSWYGCRKNGGTDGWSFFGVSASVNNIKLFDCKVEAHSDNAVYMSGNASSVLLNFVVANLRTDSTIATAKGINIVNEFVDTAIIRDFYDQVPSTGIINNGTNTIFEGFPFVKTKKFTYDFPELGSLGHSKVNVTIPGVSANDWGVQVHTGSGALLDHIMLDAEVTTNNTVEVTAHNVSSIPENPGSITFSLRAERWF